MLEPANARGPFQSARGGGMGALALATVHLLCNNPMATETREVGVGGSSLYCCCCCCCMYARVPHRESGGQNCVYTRSNGIMLLIGGPIHSKRPC